MTNVIILLLSLLILDTSAQDELLLVQVVWRDGDHVPARICKKDNNTWPYPLGQLTPKGMRQHQILGSFLFHRYAIDRNFLNGTYTPSQLYVRSVDVNRTITSATSNMVGTFYNRNGDIAGLDYPSENGWPNGYVPIPIHTIQSSNDHLLNPDADCRRHQYLIDVLLGSSEFRSLEQQEKNFLANIAEICGESVDLLIAPFIADSYRIEQSHGKQTLLSEQQYDRLESIERHVLDYVNGKNVSETNGINLSIELPKIRAGPLLWEMINRIDIKANCFDMSNIESAECKYLRNLKYYAYSTAENMFYAFLATLGAQLPSPNRSDSEASAVVFELWRTSQRSHQIKAFYVDIATYNATLLRLPIGGCPSTDYCPLETFKQQSMRYYPGNIDQLCNKVPVNWKPKVSPPRATQVSPPRRKPDTIKKAAKNAWQLVFLQTVWRHGDRNPKKICPNDNNTEPTWRKGFGQLTPLGMEQHRILGSVIYDEYVTKYKFLSQTYNAAEIYIRSTDINRTITSAMANLIGMYYDRGNESNDYPNEADWPRGLIPIPIHTVDDATDYIGDPHVVCPRKSDLVSISMHTPEIINYIEENEEFLRNMSIICGKQLDMMSVSMPADTWFVEKEHNRYRIFTEEQYNRLDRINSVSDNVYVGLLNTSEYEGYNLRIELATLSGGSILWDIIDHMDEKIRCLDPSTQNNSECIWIRDLKYYVYSARGSTLNAFLTALEAKSVHPNGELPFASAILLELWRNEKGTFEVVVRLRDESKGRILKDMTRSVGGCEGGAACPFEVFRRRSQPFNPGDIEQLCNKRAYPPTTDRTSTVHAPTTSGTVCGIVPLFTMVTALFGAILKLL